MPCAIHSDKLEGRSDEDCGLCHIADKADEAYWRQLYEGEKRAGLIPDKEFPPTPNRTDPAYWEWFNA